MFITKTVFLGGGEGTSKSLDKEKEVEFWFPGGSEGKESACNMSLPTTQVGSMGWEDPLEKETATHSSILDRRITKDRGAWWAAVHGLQRVGHDWVTSLSAFQ